MINMAIRKNGTIDDKIKSDGVTPLESNVGNQENNYHVVANPIDNRTEITGQLVYLSFGNWPREAIFKDGLPSRNDKECAANFERAVQKYLGISKRK